MNEVKGYKVFNPAWTCRDKQYTCPGKFEEDVSLSVCNRGMHFCKKAIDCFRYYNFDPNNRVAEVIAYGKVAEDGDKCCTDKLEIVREIPWAEVLELVNTGKGCTGNHNSGDYNSGNRNSGNHNSGDCNSGNRNSGNYNSGNHNSGNYNSGNHNSGDCNSGNRNSGNHNSGNYNSGDYNSGDWNKTNHDSGCFNTEETTIRMFNKQSDMTYLDWVNCRACFILIDMPTADLRWVFFSEMTDAEKEKNPNAETTGGYLKKERVTKELKQKWYEALSEDDKNAIKSLPNFDADIFEEITRIDVRKGKEKGEEE